MEKELSNKIPEIITDPRKTFAFKFRMGLFWLFKIGYWIVQSATIVYLLFVQLLGKLTFYFVRKVATVGLYSTKSADEANENLAILAPLAWGQGLNKVLNFVYFSNPFFVFILVYYGIYFYVNHTFFLMVGAPLLAVVILTVRGNAYTISIALVLAAAMLLIVGILFAYWTTIRHNYQDFFDIGMYIVIAAFIVKSFFVMFSVFPQDMEQAEKACKQPVFLPFLFLKRVFDFKVTPFIGILYVLGAYKIITLIVKHIMLKDYIDYQLISDAKSIFAPIIDVTTNSPRVNLEWSYTTYDDATARSVIIQSIDGYKRYIRWRLDEMIGTIVFYSCVFTGARAAGGYLVLYRLTRDGLESQLKRLFGGFGNIYTDMWFKRWFLHSLFSAVFFATAYKLLWFGYYPNTEEQYVNQYEKELREKAIKQYDECIDQNFDREPGYDYILKLKSNGQYCPDTDSFYNQIKREEERKWSNHWNVRVVEKKENGNK